MERETPMLYEWSDMPAGMSAAEYRHTANVHVSRRRAVMAASRTLAAVAERSGGTSSVVRARAVTHA
jgi:hypothetical protein